MAPKLKQLSLLGGAEIEHPPPAHRRVMPLDSLAISVLDTIKERRGMRAVEVGAIVHRLRGACVLSGIRYDRWTGNRSIGCCPYAASDGFLLLKRLEARGLIRKRDDGSYVARKRRGY